MAQAVRWWAASLAVLTLVRLSMAATIPLAADETYYWVWSHALAPGYLDHPPMVALWIRTGTMLAGETALGIRLLGPLSTALGSILLADAGERLFPGRQSGVAAAALLNATLLFGVGSVLMTPDTPLLFFWTAGLWATARAWRSSRGAWWLMVGLCAGLALASKYTALFLWTGIALWLLWMPAGRVRLSRPWPWAGAAIGGAVFLPVVLWNADHGWVGFLRQGGRVGDWRPARAVGFLGELIGGQIGLATPLVFLLCGAGVAAAVRRAWRGGDPAATLLAALSIPPVLVFLQHALGDRVQANWPAILYPGACIAAAGLAGAGWRRLRGPAIVVGLGITAVVYLQAATFLLPFPPLRDPIALQLAGWDGLATGVDAARRQAGAQFVAADQYALASELAFRLPPDIPVFGVEARWTLFALPPASPAGEIGLLVRNARRTDPIDPAIWRDATLVGQAARGPLDVFRFYRVTLAPNVADAVVLPQPAR